jgi:hypothetical protein
MIPPKRDEIISDIRFIPLEARSACALAGVGSHVPINKRASQTANVFFPCQGRRISHVFMLEARSNAISFPGFRTETGYLVEKCDVSALSVLLGWAFALTNSLLRWVKTKIVREGRNECLRFLFPECSVEFGWFQTCRPVRKVSCLRLDSGAKCCRGPQSQMARDCRVGTLDSNNKGPFYKWLTPCFDVNPTKR